MQEMGKGGEGRQEKIQGVKRSKRERGGGVHSLP